MSENLTKHLEEIFKDNKNWKGIQDFLRFSLFEIIDILRLNCESIKELQKQVSYKPNKNQIISMIGSKVSISDFSTLHEKYNNQKVLNNKILHIESDLKQKLLALEAKILKENIKTSQNYQIEFEQSRKIQRIQKQIDLVYQQIDEKIKRVDKALLNKADRVQIQNLCRLNGLFEKELQQMSKGLIQISKCPFPDSSQKIYEKIYQKIQKKFQSLQQQLRVQKQKYEIMQLKIQNENKKLNNQLKILIRSTDQKIYQSVEEMINITNSKKQQKYLNQLIKYQNSLQQLTINQQNIFQFNRNQQNRIQILQIKDTAFNKLKFDINKEFNRLNQIQKAIITFNRKTDQIDLQIKQISSNTQLKVFDQLQVVKQKLVKEINNKIDKFEIHRQLKQLKDQVYILIDKKLDNQRYEQDLQNIVFRGQLAEEVSQVSEKYSILIKKIDNLKDEFQNFKINESKLNESFSNAIQNKLTLPELEKFNQKFVTTQDLKILVLDLHKKIQSSEQFQKLHQFMSDQQVINQTLCSQNIIGRWVWRTGQLKNGNLIPWDKQIINTLPENFLWEEGATVLNITNNGLYKIQLGLYSKKKPTIQILVNGTTIVSAVNNNSYVIHHSSGKLKDKGNNNITGLTLVDYFLLPARARVAIAYTGQEGQGFISLKRL